MVLTTKETKKRNRLKSDKPLVYDKVIRYDEKLTRGESIAIIQLQYDYACNFRCKHCSVSTFQKIRNRRPLKIDDIKELSRQADELGLGHIDVTGGEPLVFPDLDELIEAIDPSKFYIQVDTNGWLMTANKAKHLKEIGVDKIQLSLDNLVPGEHDNFRRRRGSFARAIWAIDHIKDAGLNMQIATVVTHQRAKSDEFISFLEFAKEREVSVSVVFPKLVGQWEGRYDLMVTREDIECIHSLRDRYDVYDHLTPIYGQNLGCLAVKRMISITKFGDVLPCIWMYFSLGNIFSMSLEEILKKGMKYFGGHQELCLASESREFIDKYIAKTYGQSTPPPIEVIMPEGKYEL